jgi:hypothetical protein
VQDAVLVFLMQRNAVMRKKMPGRARKENLMPKDMLPRLVNPIATKPMQSDDEVYSRAETSQMPPAPKGCKWTATRSGDRNVLRGSKLEREVLEDIKAKSHLVNFITTGGEIWGIPLDWDRYTVRVLKESGIQVLVYKVNLLGIEGILPDQEKGSPEK